MESKDYLKDISEIKDLMNKSSRFISLSGLSGVMAGIYALIGAAVAYWLVDNSGREYLILDGMIFQLVLLDLFPYSRIKYVNRYLSELQKSS